MFIDWKPEKGLQLRQERNMLPLKGLLQKGCSRVYKDFVPCIYGTSEPSPPSRSGYCPAFLGRSWQINESDPADKQFALVNHLGGQAIVQVQQALLVSQVFISPGRAV